jgi:sugar O-acyltransferase (sialic acid O-acetyltransferase NeuD family)
LNKNQKILHIVGAGGFGRATILTARAAGWEVSGLWDDNRELRGQVFYGVIVKGSLADLAALEGVNVVLAVGSSVFRRSVAEDLPHAQFPVLTHPRAWVDEGVEIGEGSILCAGATVLAGSVIGRHTILGPGVVVDHDCEVGDYALLGPGTALSAGAVIRSETHHKPGVWPSLN